MAERLGLPYRMPVLRGHGTRPEDLRGITWQNWYDDAVAALHDLRTDAEQIVICGHSMGGLVALHIAAEHSSLIAGVATTGAALRIRDPLIRLSPFMPRFIKMWKAKPGRAFSDPSFAIHNTNYPAFPLDALVSLYRYGAIVTKMLPRVQAPLLIIHSRADQVIKPISAEIIYQRAGSCNKHIRWFERSGHEMMQDCEAAEVVTAIEEFINTLQPAMTSTAR
jgi:carboxylesterase